MGAGANPALPGLEQYQKTLERFESLGAMISEHLTDEEFTVVDIRVTDNHIYINKTPGDKIDPENGVEYSVSNFVYNRKELDD